ncbi:MAG: creatininase family protein [Firmicutes bacterium]|nr:creatininase family protein [Bacillota bacterium]
MGSSGVPRGEHAAPCYELELLTRDEAAEAFARVDTAIFPIGATEQHGHHLPLGTDNFLARDLALRLARRVGAVVLPALPIGYSWVWRDIPGTVSIDQALVKNIIKDAARSLYRSSRIRRFIVISGHGANSSAMKYAVRELADEIPVRCFHFTYPGLKQTAARHADTPLWEGMVHACELETSWMLAVRPDLVDMSKAVREYPQTPLTQGYHHSSVPMGALSQSGVFGDATAASAKKGEVMLEELVDYMVQVLDACDGFGQ